MDDILSRLAKGLASGLIEIVDLTHTLDADFPVMILPPEFGQCARFRIEEVSCYDERGPAWKWNNFSCGEHTGTHFDAPSHWVSGKDLPYGSVDTVPLGNLVAPACVIDCSAEAEQNEDYLMDVDKIREFESAHGEIQRGSWVLMRTDWSQKKGSEYINLREDGAHSPGPNADAVRFLVDERDIIGLGTETVGTDAGQAFHANPPYPAHFYLHGAGKCGLQCLSGLDRLPAKGSIIFAAPLKIRNGTGSPLRVLALMNGSGNIPCGS
ncbi:MAG: cyclase family protein [Albidovulum sp.]|nr:cyclase family protein [Albidovulum sp.]MDE0532016.1 cyclase family protein [Albidovulum sp.]